MILRRSPLSGGKVTTYSYPHKNEDVGTNQPITDVCSLGRDRVLGEGHSPVDQKRLAEIESDQHKSWRYHS
jgi:hypothetical protein